MPRRASISALTFLVALSAAPAADATFPGANGRIAYGYSVLGDCSEAGCADTSRIRTIAPTGGKWRELHSGRNPAFSADGRRIAFDYFGTVFVATASGRRARPVTKGIHPAWSPDGRTLAITRFSTEPPVVPSVYAVDLAGGPPRLLAHDADEATWSSNGELAFVRPSSNAPSQIYVAASDGTGERPLVSGSSGEPNWSPDGKRVALLLEGRMYTIGSDGVGLRRLTSSTMPQSSPVWSPDGRRIAFIGPGGGLYTVDPGSRNVRLVSRSRTRRPNRNTFEAPEWRPLPPGA